MGLDATVMCNCFRDEKTTPPPFPRDWLEIDDEGYLSLKKEHNSNENWARQYEWERSCCQHEGMVFVRENIANWTGYRLFQAALGKVGWQYFPVLEAELPNANGGWTSSAASAKALLELDVFTSAGEIGTKTVLVDTASGEELHEYVPGCVGVFLWAGSHGFNVGLSEFELFVVDARSGEDLFRATRIRQFSKSGGKVCGDRADLVWEDVDTGTVYESGVAIQGRQIPWEDGSWQRPDGRCRFKYPSAFHVERQSWLVTDFDYIVRALKSVFDASVETGNPVRWC